jgi:hypothetical protein
LSEEISANFIKKWKEEEEIDEDMLDGLEMFLNRFYIGNDTQNIPVVNGNQLPHPIFNDIPPENVSYAGNFGIESIDISYFQEVNSIYKLKKIIS